MIKNVRVKTWYLKTMYDLRFGFEVRKDTVKVLTKIGKPTSVCVFVFLDL